MLQSAAGCGGGGISTADVLIAWVKVTRREGMSYVVCLSVDIAGRIDTLDDLSLVVTTPSESACKGAKPNP